MCGYVRYIKRMCGINKIKAKLQRTKDQYCHWLLLSPGSHDLFDAIIRESGKSQGRDLQHDGKALPEAPATGTKSETAQGTQRGKLHGTDKLVTFEQPQISPLAMDQRVRKCSRCESCSPRCSPKMAKQTFTT